MVASRWPGSVLTDEEKRKPERSERYAARVFTYLAPVGGDVFSPARPDMNQR